MPCSMGTKGKPNARCSTGWVLHVGILVDLILRCDIGAALFLRRGECCTHCSLDNFQALLTGVTVCVHICS